MPDSPAAGADPTDHADVVTPWFRLGYVIPHLYTDLDAYQFYRVAPEGARHYRSADQSVRVGATVAALVEAGRVGVEEIDRLPKRGTVYDEDAQHARAD